YLRLAYMREQMRSATYLRICADVLETLERDAVNVIVLRGAAAVSLLADPALRHCHDIDLLVRPSDVERAVDALERRGLGSPDATLKQASSGVTLRHASGLPIALHTRLFDAPLYDLSFDDVSSRTRNAPLGGRAIRVLS